MEAFGDKPVVKLISEYITGASSSVFHCVFPETKDNEAESQRLATVYVVLIWTDIAILGRI